MFAAPSRRPLIAGTIAAAILVTILVESDEWMGEAGAQAPAAPEEIAETFKEWKLYCQVWPETPRRVECEVSTARGVGARKESRLVWYRSSVLWREGLRFRLDEASLRAGPKLRVWLEHTLFRPEFPCQPFPFEPNTCAVGDPTVNAQLVQRLNGPVKSISVAGPGPDGRPTEVIFALEGFKAALQRMEDIRAQAGVEWK